MCFRQDINLYWEILAKVETQNLELTRKEFEILKENNYPFINQVKVKENVSQLV